LLISTHEEQVDFSERSLISQASTAWSWCARVLLPKELELEG
jgi:hypothetical protein